MGTVDGSGSVDPTRFSSQFGGADATNKAEQMYFVLQLLKSLVGYEDSSGGTAKLLQTFQAELKQIPPPIQAMQQQLNKVITSINQHLSGTIPPIPAWTGANSTDTGQSFMHFILAFAQFAAGASGGNAALEAQVGILASYNGHWSPKEIYSHLQEFLVALNNADLKSPIDEGDFPKIEIPINNFFS